MTIQQSQKGVTLIELLVTIAILGLILGGLYGLLDTGHRMYLNTRALVESQQTARVVLDYLTDHIREIDGGGTVSLGANPTKCTECHVPELDNDPDTDDETLPCPKDVLVPRRNIFLDNLTTISTLTALTNIDPMYQQDTDGNAYIEFWADRLPRHGVSDTFTDSPSTGTYSAFHNGKWDLTYDVDNDNKYDHEDGDREIIYYDINDNGSYDYYGEKWILELQDSPNGDYYELVETLSFGNFTSKNNSVYAHDTTGQVHQKVPIAYGITALDIQIVGKDLTALKSAYSELGVYEQLNCATSGCHEDVYGAKDNFDYEKFVKTHSRNGTFRSSWWNIKGFSIEVATTDPRGQKFTKMKQFVIPRNLEANR